LTTILRLSGRLDHAALDAALGTVIDRHEVLRTLFERVEQSGSFRPVIGPTGSFRLDIRRLTAAEAARPESLAQQEAGRPFDPFNGPIVRAVLLVMSEEDAILIFGGHHIAIDGISFDLLWQELALAYEAAAAGGSPALEPVRLQYVDFAGWERTQLAPERVAALTSYWRERLAGVPAFLNLPFDRPRPVALSLRTGAVRRGLVPELVASIQNLAAAKAVTPFIILESALAILCAQLARSREVVIGTVGEGRGHAAFERTVGMFVIPSLCGTRCHPGLPPPTCFDRRGRRCCRRSNTIGCLSPTLLPR
jgi:hypothetical protein